MGARGSTHEDFGREKGFSVGSNRTFGLVFGGALLLLSFAPLIHGGNLRLWLLAISVVPIVVGLFVPKLLGPLNAGWMWIGHQLGRIVSPIVMMVIFFGAVMPVGMVARLLGKDLIGLRRRREVSTYWIERTPGPAAETLKNQF